MIMTTKQLIFPEAYLSLNLPFGGPSRIFSTGQSNVYLGFKAIPESPIPFKGFTKKWYFVMYTIFLSLVLICVLY